MFDALKEHEADLLRCLRCAECHAGCPLYQEDKNESYTARSKMRRTTPCRAASWCRK